MSLIKVHIPAKVAAADATDAPINDVKMAIASTGAKVISVRSDQPNWFTFTIEGKSVRSVSQIIDKVSRVARVRKNSPEMWNPVTDPKNFKLQLAFDAANDSAAQDRGNYATNTIALLKMAIGNLRTADSVVRRVVSNIGDAMDKVKDERAKSSLKSMQQEWWACEREMWAALEKLERIPVPSGVGVPNKQKLSPEDRKFIDEFFE